MPTKPDSVSVAQRPLVQMSSPVSYSSLVTTADGQFRVPRPKSAAAAAEADPPSAKPARHGLVLVRRDLPPRERSQNDVNREFEQQLMAGKSQLKSYGGGSSGALVPNGHGGRTNDDADSGISMVNGNGASPTNGVAPMAAVAAVLPSPPPPPPPPPPPQFEDDGGSRRRRDSPSPPTIPPPPPMHNGRAIPPAPR